MPGNQDCLNIDWLVVLQEVSGYRFERFIISLKRFEKGKFTATEESSFEDPFFVFEGLGPRRTAKLLSWCRPSVGIQLSIRLHLLFQETIFFLRHQIKPPTMGAFYC